MNLYLAFPNERGNLAVHENCALTIFLPKDFVPLQFSFQRTALTMHWYHVTFISINFYFNCLQDVK